MPAIWLMILFVGHLAGARPVVVFDLDHTLVDTNTRIIVILRELAVELDVPELLAVTTEQIEALRRQDLAPLKLRDPGVIARLFREGGVRESPFGRRFYRDGSYLTHDAVIPGAPEFVARIARDLDADVIYLTGRLENAFSGPTLEQLKHWDFPGPSPKRPFAGSWQLILKPDEWDGPTDAFKVAEFEKIARDHDIVAVFDDASRNVNAFARVLPPGVPIVRLTRDVDRRPNLHDRVEQITNYVYNTRRTPDGEFVSRVNAGQINDIIARARRCAAELSR